MKKQIFLALICSVLFLMPAFGALPIKKTNDSKKITSVIPTVDSDGTFVGGFGRMYKENDEWQFEYYGYLGGFYKDKGKYKILYANIYDLDKEKIGNITLINFKSYIIGKIKNLDGKSAPIVGFFFINEEGKFAGRLMSVFGPAPHIWGEFTPN
jgi:hypothetical protein